MNGDKSKQSQRLLSLFKEKNYLRSKDLEKDSIQRQTIRRLLKSGQVIRVQRGLYRLPDIELSQHLSLLEVGLKAPRSVICLLSALVFHEIGTQNPHQVWIAIGPKDKKPKFEGIQVRIIRFSPSSLHYGVENHSLDGFPVKVTSPAKTVADCFKFRNKIGIDIAKEALREGWYSRKFIMEDLYQAARVCRVWDTIRPYAEMLE